MEIIDAKTLDYKAINEALRRSDDACTIQNCCGQRFLASGMSQKDLTIYGIPGNALGAYLNNAAITVYGNGQDAVGDTMNEGQILIHGNIGDAAGYAMRGGKIYVKGNAGYRAGIHMKEYKEKKPLMIIGGYAGSFLGEYQAGGVIIVLGLSRNKKRIVGNFPCTGMHGGKIFLRDDCHDIKFPEQVTARRPGKIWMNFVNIYPIFVPHLIIKLMIFYRLLLPSSPPTVKIRINRCMLQINRKQVDL